MNKLKLIIGVSLIFLLGVSLGAFGTRLYTKHKITKFIGAGDPPAPRILRRLSERLDLSDSQKADFEKIQHQSLTKWTAFRQKYQPEFQSLFEETIGQLKEVLSDEQKQKLDDHYNRLKKRIRTRKDRRPPLSTVTQDRLLSDIKKHLSLTESQEAKVLPLIESSMKQQRQIFKSLRSEIQKHQKTVEDQLGTILTPEQMEKYRKLQAKHRPKLRPPR
jgi:Spy/CpxP family protein refolding chaperone